MTNIQIKKNSTFYTLHSTFRSGFTLTELLIVISIIAILVLMVMLAMNYKTQIQKARDTKRKNDLQLIKTKLEDYYNDNESYPPPPDCGETCCEVSCNNTFFSPYLEKFPCDPQNKKYIYCADLTKSQWYKIYTNFEYSKDKIVETSGCKDGCLVTGRCCNYGISSSNTSIVTESFCGLTITPIPTGTPTPVPTTPPTITPIPTGIYTTCQVGICNVVGDPATQCGEGKQFPVCFFNDPTCGNCSGPDCLPAPQCYQ